MISSTLQSGLSHSIFPHGRPTNPPDRGCTQIVFIFTNFVMLNLFVAVILENFHVAEDQKMAMQEKLFWEAERRRGRGEAEAEKPFNYQSCKGNPCCYFLCPEQDPPSKFRQKCKAFSDHPIFEGLIITVILLSSISLALEGPEDAEYLRPYPDVLVMLEVTDVAFFIIFWIEFVLKVIGNGFGCQDGAYLNDGWNRLDFTVVFFTTIDFSLRYLAPGTDASWARVFRMLRVLRPLRIASKCDNVLCRTHCKQLFPQMQMMNLPPINGYTIRYDNIRVIIDSLIASVSGVMATLVLAFFFSAASHKIPTR